MVNLNYNKELYRKDFIRYVFYQRKVYLIVSLICTCLGIAVFIVDNVNEEIFNGFDRLKPYIYILSGSSLLSAVWDLGSLFLNIRKSSNQLPKDTQTLFFKPQRIELSHFGSPFVIFISDLKGYKIIHETIFLVSKNKKSWPIRINPKEVSPGGMSLFMDELKRIKLTRI